MESIYTTKDESTFLCVCVCHAHLKRGSRTIGAKNMKKYPENAVFLNHGRPLFWPTRSGARQPAQTRSNPRWRRQKLGLCDPGRISANFSYPEGSISFYSFDCSGEPACMTSRPENLKCVRAPFAKGESAPWGLTIWKQYLKNAHSKNAKFLSHEKVLLNFSNLNY